MKHTKLILLTLTLLCFGIASSQEVVQLHTLVGDTIDNGEKVAFYLFPEINDSSFVQGVIFYQDSTFKVNVTEKLKGKYEFDIDTTSLKEYHYNIEKLALYYSKLAAVDSVEQKELQTAHTSIQTSPEFRLTAEQRKKLVKDARRYWRKKDKAEDIGLWGVDKENYIKAASHTNILKAKIRFK